jgi:Family of unknown function (DUF5996)
MTTSPSNQAVSFSDEVWPSLPWAEWGDTCTTLQMWMQIIGKIRMTLMPHLNHCWGVTLYPTIRGVTTSPMPYGRGMLQIDFDFVDHMLRMETSGGGRRSVPLTPITVAEFYARVMGALEQLGTPVEIRPMPCEVAEPIPLDQDEVHRTYDPDYANRFWRVLLQTTRVMTAFRARFRGKVSPIHLFWGAMDLACTRFSGRTAPEHASMPGLPDRVVRDAYSHEVSSAGFWPGAPGMDAMFYSYAYPEPAGYREYAIRPGAAGFSEAFGEFVLPYEAMRTAADPDGALMEFLQSTYEAAAECAKWDRAGLEVG